MKRHKSHRPRVLLLVDKTGFGGVQTMARDLIAHIESETTIDLYIFFLRDIDFAYNTRKLKHPHVFYSKSKYKYSIFTFFQLVKLINSLSPDILHLNGDKSLVFGALAKKIFPNLKTIHHEHGPVLRNSPLYNAILKILGTKIDFFIAVSGSVQNALLSISASFKDRIFYLPNYVSKIYHERQSKIGLISVAEKKEIMIGFVGRLVREKGCKHVIDALSKLDSQYHATIIGDGVERASLVKYAMTRNVSDRINFAGYDERPDYRIFDILVVPSLRESFGMVVVEAWASGVPVVASNVDGLRELIQDKHTGLLHELGDIPGVVSNVELLSSDSDLYSTIVNKSHEASQKYSFTNFISKLSYIYHEIIQR